MVEDGSQGKPRSEERIRLRVVSAIEMLRQVAAELHLDAHLNGNRVTQTRPRLESPRFHGLSGRLLKSVLARGPHNRNIVNEAIGADYNFERHGAIDLFLPWFLRTLRIGCVSRTRRLVGAGLRILHRARLQERLRIFRGG